MIIVAIITLMLQIIIKNLQDKEGLAEFNVPCPEMVNYAPEKLKTCPEK